MEGRQIIYMDETSTHLCEKMKSFWMPKDRLIDVRLNKSRGKSVTIIGGISEGFEKLEYIIADKTNIANFKRFLTHIKPHIKANNCVMVLDNHGAHTSDKAVNFADKMGIKLEPLPATASELNPIERMWSYFKKKWRQKLYNPHFQITSRNSIDHIRQTLAEIEHLDKNLAKGPMKHMKKWCKPEGWQDRNHFFKLINRRGPDDDDDIVPDIVPGIPPCPVEDVSPLEF